MGMVSAISPTLDETFDMFQNTAQRDSGATTGAPSLPRFPHGSASPSSSADISPITAVFLGLSGALSSIHSATPSSTSSLTPSSVLPPPSTAPQPSSTAPPPPSTALPPPSSVLPSATPTDISSGADPSAPFSAVFSSPPSVSTSSSASLPPNTKNKPNAAVPVGAIIGGAIGGMIALCITAFLLWRCGFQRRAGHHYRINTNLEPLYITPFHVTPSGSTMAETNNRTPNTYYNPPMTSSPESNPFSSPNHPSAISVLGTTPRIWNLSGRKASPRAPPILRMHEDSGMRGVTDEVVDVPPSYTSQ